MPSNSSSKPLPPSNRSLIQRVRRATQHGDVPWNFLIGFMALAVLALMLAVFWLLWGNSGLARQTFGLDFILPAAQTSWNPIAGKFQAWPFVYGTLLTSFFSIILAVPISLGIAIFLAELCPNWLRTPLNWMIELLAAIPSVVYGLWGIFVFLPAVVTPIGEALQNSLGVVPGLSQIFAGPIPASGASRLAASLILTIMIIPTITAVTRDVFLAIPDNQREAAMALGSTRWEAIWKVLVPYGLSGILGAVILGLGRALGETMAVTMVIGNNPQSSLSLLRPGYTMSSIIANEFAEAVNRLHTEALMEIGLVLFIMTLLLNLVARFLVWRVASRSPQMEARI